MTERNGDRQCVRPGCTRPAVATLAFRYDTRQAWLSTLAPEPIPATYDLCSVCAGRTNPPRGWYLVDERPDVEPAAAPADPGTVAVLAAALADDVDPAATAAFDGPAIVDAVDEAPSAEVERSVSTGVEPSEPSVAAEHREPQDSAAQRTQRFAGPDLDREGVRPVMAALLGEAEGPLVSLSAVDDLPAARSEVAVGSPRPPGAPEPDPQPSGDAPTAATAPAEPARSMPEPAAEISPVAATAPSDQPDGSPAPRLFAVPTYDAPRGTASVW